MKKKAQQHRKVRPIETEKPISWPTALPSTLNEDAQTLYRRGSCYLDRDPFDRSLRNRFIPREEKDSYVANERVVTAAAELKAHGLGAYNPRYRSLSVQRVHEHYTVAEGRGTQFVRVYLTDPDAMGGRGSDETLLAVLVGADIETRDVRSDSVPLHVVRARHWTATDVEHDASSTAHLSVLNPTAPVFTGYGRMSFMGLLTEARLYPLGVDPLKADDGENRPGDVCDSCDEPHPFAPFLPPKLEQFEQRPQLVRIECVPMRPYLVTRAS